MPANYNKKNKVERKITNLLANVQEANQIQKPAKILISGPTNAGKTFGGLVMLKGLTKNGKVLIVDSENRRSALHVGDPVFGSWKWDAIYCSPDDFNGFNIAKVIEDAQKAGYEGLLIDSYTHIWEEVTDTANALGGRYTDFREAKEPYKRFLKAFILSDLHIVCTSRSAMEYSQDTDANGKKTVTKLGLKPQGESNFPFEPDYHFVIDENHFARVDKTTRGMFEDLGRFYLTEDHAVQIRQFLSEGLPADYTTRQLYISRMRELVEDATNDKLEVNFGYDDATLIEMTPDELKALGSALKDQIKQLKDGAASNTSTSNDG